MAATAWVICLCVRISYGFTAGFCDNLCSSRLISPKTTGFFTLQFAKKRKHKPKFLFVVVFFSSNVTLLGNITSKVFE